MSDYLYRIGAFLRFYKKATNVYGIHSPFVFDFIQNVLDDSKEYYAFKSIEIERQKLLLNRKMIQVDDFGAGSKNSLTNATSRHINDIARTSLSSSKKGRILFQIAHHYKRMKILELGTSLGISSAYLASANSQSQLYTLEGSVEIAKIAESVHSHLKLKNIQYHIGRFSDTLPTLLNDTFDLVFLDGHHEYNAVLAYFEILRPSLSQDAIVIVDDIYWSKGMEKAWNELKQQDIVTASVDLFDMGILFLRSGLSKQDFCIVPYHLKPWKLGVWGK